jgi:hypothetical protein
MLKKIMLLTLSILFLVSVGWGLPAAAQGDLRLAELRVRLWPEYDRAALLVILEGTLAEDTAFPATVTLSIPARVPAPFVVAAMPTATATSVDEVEYENAEAGEWRTITFQAGGPSFQLEYYDSLERQGEARAPSFTWAGDYAVDSLLFQFQQPPHTESLTLAPELPQAQISSEDNLTYHTGEFGPLAAGETFTLRADYTRSEDTLTAELLSALQSGATTQTSGSTAATAASESFSQSEILITAVVAVAAFLLGAASMRLGINWQSNRRRSSRK